MARIPLNINKQEDKHGQRILCNTHCNKTTLGVCKKETLNYINRFTWDKIYLHLNTYDNLKKICIICYSEH